jgi:CMP-N-acetylneuraminic acid synthetase
LLTDWVVSTEDREIADLALSYGALVVERPEYLARDDSTSGAVARHALGWMEVDREPYDMVVLLHPTSPIRDPKHTYTHNASIYAMRSDWLIEAEQHYCDQSIPFLMDARHSVDIDTEEDFKIAELFLNG